LGKTWRHPYVKALLALGRPPFNTPLPKGVKSLQKVYGDRLPSVIGCKPSQIQRCIEGRPVFSERQVSKVHMLILIERIIKAEKNGRL